MAGAKRNSQSQLALPDNLVGLISAAEKRHGFPVGTLNSLMQQEVGGDAGRYLQDPTAYHYPLNANGQRVAGHTGKVSTAFGPFGLLESTAKDPGYGVAPLKDKTIGEQIRFAADYLAARSKQAGGLVKGLAGYGEGARYGQQVAARIPAAAPQAAQVVAAAAPVVAQPVGQATGLAFEPQPPAPVIAAQGQAYPEQVAQAPADMAPLASGPDAWQGWLAQSQAQAPAEVMAYGGQPGAFIPPQARMPDFSSMLNYAQLKPDFRSFMGYSKNRGRA